MSDKEIEFKLSQLEKTISYFNKIYDDKSNFIETDGIEILKNSHLWDLMREVIVLQIMIKACSEVINNVRNLLNKKE